MSANWSEARTARLGYLVGIGWDAARIARDATIRSDAGEVHRQARRLNLTFREATVIEGSPLNLDGARMAYFDAAARPRRLPTEALLRKLCEVVGDDRLVDELLGPVTAAPINLARPARRLEPRA